MAVIGGGNPDWFLGVWKYAPMRLGKITLSNSIIFLEPCFYGE
jgi:hypothetical protein